MNNPYWDRICDIAEKQRAKGIETYGQGIEANDKDIHTRISMALEELVDLGMYLCWIDDKIRSREKLKEALAALEDGAVKPVRLSTMDEEKAENPLSSWGSIDEMSSEDHPKCSDKDTCAGLHFPDEAALRGVSSNTATMSAYPSNLVDGVNLAKSTSEFKIANSKPGEPLFDLRSIVELSSSEIFNKSIRGEFLFSEAAARRKTHE